MSSKNVHANPKPLRKYAPLLAVIGVVALIMAGAYLAQSGIGIFRHDDPSQSKDSLPSAVDLALMYSAIAGHISEEDFANASMLIAELDGANIPESVQYTFARFNALLLSQIYSLNITGADLSEALAHVKVGKTADAQFYVTNGTWMLAKANITWSDLADAAEEISTQFKMRELTPELELIMQLIGRHAEELGDVVRSIEEIEAGNVTRTSITLTVGANELIAGGRTWASGTLRAANGTPLSGMPVAVYAGGSVTGATTGADGSYNVTVAPAGYEENITVAAALLPQQGYAGSISSEETVLVNFIKPSITIALDKGFALPQQSFEVIVHLNLSEWVYSNFSTPLPSAAGALVNVLAFGQSISVYVPDGSDAHAQFSVPYGAPEGASQVAASVYPDKFVGPATSANQITVFRYAPTVSIEAPGYALGGFPFTVSGSVLSNGSGIPNARVSLSAEFAGGDAEYLDGTTDESGRFSINVHTGALAQSGAVMIGAYVYPAEDIFADGYARSSTYVVSPVAVAIPILALGALGGVFFMRPRGSGRGAMQAGAPLAVAIAAPSGPRQLPPESTVAGAYARAASWVGSALRRIKPSETVREYYSSVEPGLGEAKSPFRTLTSMLEESLYGMKEASVPEAQGLLGKIKALFGMGKSKDKGQGKSATPGTGTEEARKNEG